jgi:hypothetical protein
MHVDPGELGDANYITQHKIPIPILLDREIPHDAGYGANLNGRGVP